MAKWTDYAEKEGIADNDEIIILDKESNTNKRSIVSNIVNGAVEKIGSHKFSGLNTDVKTLVGAINEVDAKNDAQDEKISTLESDINEAGTKNTEQDERLEAVENELSTFLKKTDVDSTLSVADSPADAKAVGDAVGSLKEDISNKITKFYASNQGETHLADSDSGKIQDMMIYGKSEQFTTTGKNLANGQNANVYINGSVNVCGFANGNTGMAIDVSKLTNVTISTRSIQDRYRAACVNTIPQQLANTVTCYNGKNKDGTKVSYTIDTTDYNYLIINATKLEDIQAEEGAEATSYEPYTGGKPSPSPDYPQEIKSVVNPVIKACGANILNIKNKDETVSDKNGLTYSAKNGVIKVKGTATSNISIGIMQQTASTRLKLKKNNTYIFNPNPVKTKESDNVYLDFTNSYSIGISLKSNNVNKPIKINEKDTKREFDLVVRVKQGEVIDMEWKPQLLLNESLLPYKPYTEQTVALPYTFNAIPVESGGNITIDGQQYIADYVDVERGKIIKKVDSSKLDNTQSIIDKTEWLLAEPQEIDLTEEEISALKAFATYYPVTNIFANSEQLDGYTVFNYPISMKNGWDYVKQQIGDTRDYIYDMDLRSAEAYVNSKYAVALIELEV